MYDPGPAMNSLRVAVVGLGWVGTHRHLPWLRRSRSVEVVGVIDHNLARVDRAKTQFKIARATVAERPNEVPWLDEVDAVTIATPPATHAALATAYLRAGKDVLLEKPMAVDLAGARALKDLAEREGRILALVHNFQFARSSRDLQRLIRGGRLGDIKGLWGAQLSNPERRLPEWYETLPLGLFYDESPHFFYLVRSVLGAEPEIEYVQTVPGAAGRSTPASISLVMRAGSIPVQISMNFEAPVSEWHLTVIGSRALAVVDVFRDVLVVTRNDRQHLGRNILMTSADAVTGHLGGVARSGALNLLGRLAYGNDEVIARFVDACRTRTTPRDISAADGLEVVRLQHEVIDRSHIAAG